MQVQVPVVAVSETVLLEYYEGLRSAAYMQYLDILAGGTGVGGSSVGRVPTLAEWRGDVQWASDVGVGGSDGWRQVGCGGGKGCFEESRVESGGPVRDGGDDRTENVGGTANGVGDGGKTGGVPVGGGLEACEVPGLVSGRGVNFERNKANREKKKKQKQWRMSGGTRGHSVRGAGAESSEASVGSVATVDTRTGVEIEAAQTLAARRVSENKQKKIEAEVAAKLAEHRLRALNDKERTLVIDRLAAARLEEKINTAKQKSQASFKGCGSPIESVGSALSAHEFAFKQQVRKIEALKQDVAYQRKQVEEFYRYAAPDVRQRVAEIPEPYIPTDEEMEAEDLDQSPEPSDEEMEAEAERYFSGVIV